jgi:23S rRNA (cytidine2498-2'-O)-methyltransferase
VNSLDVCRDSALESAKWLVKSTPVFSPWRAEIFSSLGASKTLEIDSETFLLTFSRPLNLTREHSLDFSRWLMPVHHLWPTPTLGQEGFVEKAAQTLVQKFFSFDLNTGDGQTKEYPQNVFIGGTPNHVTLKKLAANLRGRTVQLLSEKAQTQPDPESVIPQKDVLFVYLTPKLLAAGTVAPRYAKSFFPGGTKFAKQSGDGNISRAAGKCVEALAALKLFAALPKPGSHWLELGASPGGITSELLQAGYKVTAVDRARLSEKLHRDPHLVFLQQDVASLKFPNAIFDGLICDMNGDPQESLVQVARLSRSLKPLSPVVFTLKFAGINQYAQALQRAQEMRRYFYSQGIQSLQVYHSTYNREEVTFVGQKAAGFANVATP